MKQQMKVKKLSNDAIIPSYAHPGDAGMDIYSCVDLTIKAGQFVLVPTGISVQLPENTEAQIRPKSGLALKHGITVLNTPGTIDEGYRGEVGVILVNHGSVDFEVKKGSKVAQMVIKPVINATIVETNDLDDSKRGTGGFGSTGV